MSHCGAGCTLGDIGGEWILFAVGAPTLGLLGTYGSEVIVDFALAWTFGVVFQYFTIVPMRENVGRLEGIWQAIEADFTLAGRDVRALASPPPLWQSGSFRGGVTYVGK